MAYAELERDPGAHAVADHVGLLEPELPDQARHVVGHLLVGDLAVDVARAPVALHLGHDHLSVLRETLAQRPEGLHDHVGAVEQHERRSRAVDLVVHLELADRRMAGSHLGVRHPLSIEQGPSRLRSRG